MAFTMPVDAYGYEQGTVLRDVPYREVLDWDCNQCGDCCDGTRDGVVKDEATGLPKFVWAGERTADEKAERTYEERFGYRLIQPLVMGDGGPVVGEAYEIDADGKPYRSFKCAAFVSDGDERGHCGVYDTGLRPQACGEFPVFGPAVADTIINSGYFVPATGTLPRCEWYGIRVTGPFRDEEVWQERFAAQERGEQVEPLELPDEFVAAMVAKREARRVT